jgi:hypothetical protein
MNWNDDYLNDIWHHGSSDRELLSQTMSSTVDSNPFKIGDTVKLKTGNTNLVVKCIAGPNVRAVYKNGREQRWRCSSDYTLVKSAKASNKIKGKEMKTGKLYQTRETIPRFGTYLATNSQNKIVLEMKGSGVPELFDASEIEVVTPYTFDVQFNGEGRSYAYLGHEGEVSVGDLLLKTDGTRGINIARVIAVDTKSEMATKYFDGVKIVTTALKYN